MTQSAKPADKGGVKGNTRLPLGRGLSALFGDADVSYQAPVKGAGRAEVVVGGGAAESAKVVEGAAKAGAVQTLPVGYLQSGKYQPRSHFEEEALMELAASIRARGVLEPLLVRPLGKDSYEIVAGERRWRAAQLAGLHDVPVLVKGFTDREALEFGIIENVQREDLSPLEEGEGYQRLLDEFGHTQEALSKIVGKSRPHITNMLRMLALPPEVRSYLADGRLSAGHARALATTVDPTGLAQEVVRKGLNVRQTEALARKRKDNPQLHKSRKAGVSADVQGLERELERVIGLKVRIVTKGKGGTLTLNYHDLDQLDEIIRKLRGA